MRALFLGQFDSYATPEVRAEYQLAIRSRSVREAAAQVGIHPNNIHDYAAAVNECVLDTEPGPSFQTSDPDDDKFTACSTGCHAEFIVSSDHSLLDLGSVLEATVVTPEQFVEQLR